MSTDPAPETAPRRTPDAQQRRDRIARSVLRGAGIILVVTVIARIAGFVRYLVFGASVGAGDVGTAYTTANMLPNVLFEIVAGGALAAVVVPLIAGLVPERNTEDQVVAEETLAPDLIEAQRERDRTRPPAEGAALADRIISVLLTWTLIGTVLLAALVIALAEPLARLLLAAESTGAAGVPLGTTLLRIFAVQLPLYGIAVVLAAYLQARKRFLWPAMMPLLSSLAVMVSYRVYAHLVPSVATTTTIDAAAVQWLGWGTTAGVAVMALPVAIAALRSGLRLRPALRMPAQHARRALALGGAGVGAVGAQQLVLALVMLMAMRAGGVGTLPVFQYAQALYLLPYAVLVVPLVTSVFPHLSELRLVGDITDFAKVAATSVRTVMLVAVIGAAMLIAAGPALEQFFRLIDRAGASGVGATTAGLALGLVGFAVATQCTRILSAALRARDALLVGSAGWVIAAGVMIILVLPSPERSAAEAATVFGLSIAVGQAAGGLVGLSRITDILEPGGHFTQVRRTAIAVPVALLAGAIPGLLLGRLLVTVRTGEVLTVVYGILCGLVAAALAAAVIALTDRELAGRVLRRVRAGRYGPEIDAPTGDARKNDARENHAPKNENSAGGRA
ncbi:murein biosynthesis integral membrane protein MurJ [Brachybacterium aquaticum]|uniref:Putative peptidoglycan lipid II flippase n=1 Tax=Brachybacterium aquaticum TaxID=1432564 RepID=A0A841A8X8_9MICO|nr:lipid II flippase MurJ [Brachybacterium aquaticum]MBB5831679.1 putative peptidoglycan lipid II flippase [Brachybacterium aquaticum]